MWKRFVGFLAGTLEIQHALEKKDFFKIDIRQILTSLQKDNYKLMCNCPNIQKKISFKKDASCLSINCSV